MTSNAVEGGGWVPALTFPARLALVRNRMGWNAKEAALACGLPAQSWRNWESGSRPHDYLRVCQLIAQRTGANLEWLIGLNEPAEAEPYRPVTGEYPGGIAEADAAPAKAA